MQLQSFVAVLAVVSAAVAGPLNYPRQAGGTPSGKPPGTQFITGNCASDTDCASTCCDAKTGLCAAKLVAQEDGHGCGFSSGATAPVASSVAPVAASVAASAPAAAGTQFITGTCTADADCASTCCDAVTGLCAAKLVAQEDGHGCGFNSGAAAPVASSAAAPAAASVAVSSAAASAPAAAGTQFITGTCSADSDCASTCCDAVTGLCAAKLVAEQNGHGCGFDGTPKAASAAATGAASAAAPASTAGGQPSGKPPGTQFITGNCSSDADCNSTCCDAKTGLCAAQLVAQENGHGCGFTPARRFI